MNYRVKIVYWSREGEGLATLTDVVYALDYVQALKMIVEKYTFKDTEIVEVEAVSLRSIFDQYAAS